MHSAPNDFQNVVESMIGTAWEDIFSPYSGVEPPPTSSDFISSLCLGALWAAHATDDTILERYTVQALACLILIRLSIIRNQLLLSNYDRTLMESVKILERELDFVNTNPYFLWLSNPENFDTNNHLLQKEDDRIYNKSEKREREMARMESQEDKEERLKKESKKREKEAFSETQGGFAHAVEVCITSLIYSFILRIGHRRYAD